MRKFDVPSDARHNSRIATKVLEGITLCDEGATLTAKDKAREAFWKKAYPLYVTELRNKRSQVNANVKRELEG